MTLAEQLIQEGLSRGLSRQRRLVQRQLELKFGVLTSEASARVEMADEQTLERYAERVITAPSLAEVFADS